MVIDRNRMMAGPQLQGGMQTRPEMGMRQPMMAPQQMGNMQVPEPAAPAVQAIGHDQIQEWMLALQKYKAGKSRTEARIISSENWWKLRNTTEEENKTAKVPGFHSKSAWLHNVIVNKHADAIEAYPSPNILAREQGDDAEAKMLSQIIPVVLEQNGFEEVYSNAAWQKCKSGTGVYKVVWDAGKLNGLGDIAIENVNLLNVFWEPGITDIQRSRYFFHTELQDNDLLLEEYPQLEGKLGHNTFLTSKFLYDDTVSDDKKTTVIEVYYRKRGVLHYCKFVGDEVLFATENDPEFSERGLYDHGRFPYVFDPLFPIEGSPCGYGYVDVCRNPQEELDLMKTSLVKNTMVACTPRFLTRQDGNINEGELLDLTKPIVHVNGSVDEAAIRQVSINYLSSNYINMMQQSINELRETSGNTETATGTTSSGVTAASAIAALQEASGKSSKAATKSAYRAFTRITDFVIELIRQFYDLPRQFRIVGQDGMAQYISYSNAGIQPQEQGMAFGQDMGYRLPVFDIRVEPQKRNAYTKLTQNEMAIQFLQLGVFAPGMADQVLPMLEMMDFDGKDKLQQRIQQNYAMMQLMMMNGMAQQAGNNGAQKEANTQAAAGKEQTKEEPGIVRNARERSNQASQPV